MGAKSKRVVFCLFFFFLWLNKVKSAERAVRGRKGQLECEGLWSCGRKQHYPRLSRNQTWYSTSTERALLREAEKL